MNKKIVAQNTTVLIGADVHSQKHVVSVKVGSEMLGTVQLAPKPKAWRSFLKRFPGCEVHVMYESGPQGYNLHDWLVEMNGESGQAILVHIAPPAMVPKVPGKKSVKTDKRDSRELILAYEMKSFRPVVVPDKQKREERELVRTRCQMKAAGKRLKNQIHGLMKFHGIHYPHPRDAGAWWSEAWIKQLIENTRAVDTTGCLLMAVKTKIKMLKETNKAVSSLDRRIEKLYHKGHCSRTAQKIERIRGIGKLSSVLIATEVADFAAFDNSNAFASYTGLVPGEHSSGETKHYGHITRAGNRRLRWIFVQCAWNRVRYDPKAKDIYKKLKLGKQDRSRLAIVALARRLAVETYHTAMTDTPPERAA